ncbi:hypothetical protein [Nocardioides rubriscoriae]|uniref:hypothetical protein n=1 Tax=Nocardioides rubriscoriae TaxID=642762 RepID=UPI0011DFA2B6|nr:hypothetical protein [Nocardioides rubriscoriae]
MSYSDLLQFFYQCPVGLVETDEAAHVTLVNPAAARLLAPVLGNDDLSDLLPVLERLSPELLSALTRERTALGPIGAGRRFTACTNAEQATWVELLAVRVEPGRLMFVVLDADREQELVRRERVRALEVNDQIVQSLVAAETAFGLGRPDRAAELVSSASAAGRRWIGEQLAQAGGAAAGVVRRRDAAEPVAEAVEP